MNNKSPSLAVRVPYGEPMVARSALLRKLIRTRDDPATQRLREWFSQMDDLRLMNFGLSPVDIMALRGQASFLSG